MPPLNLIYLLICENFNIQYVGETVLTLQTRININRKAEPGSNHMIKHFRNDCSRSSLIIKVLEIFPGTGYENKKVCPIKRVKRFKREIEDTEDQNEKATKHDSKVPVGKLFCSINKTK